MSSFTEARSSPSQSSDDVRAGFYFSSGAHETAYDHLLEGIRTHEGCILLTGEAGSGKTLLLYRLIHDQSAAIQFVYCPGDRLDFDQLLGFICHEMALSLSRFDRSGCLRAINDYLGACVERGVVVALLLDDAHLLSDTVLGQLIVLKIARPGREQATLRLVFSGLPDLRNRVAKRHSFAAKTSNPLGIYLDGFNSSETIAFIRSQYPAAAFSDAEIDEIHTRSHGRPGVVEKLCQQKTGYKQPDDKHIRQQAIASLMLPTSPEQAALGVFLHRTKQKLKLIKLIWCSIPAIAVLSLLMVLLTGAIILTSMPDGISSDETDPLKTAAQSTKAIPRQEQPGVNENITNAAMTIAISSVISSEPQNDVDSKDVLVIDADMPLQQAPRQPRSAVAALLEKARVALVNKALTTPQDDSAVKWAEEALRIDTDNVAANEILSVVIDHYLYWSAQKLDDQQLQKASHYLSKAQSLQHYASQTQIGVAGVLDDEIRSYQHSLVTGKTVIRGKERRNNSQSFARWINSMDARMKHFGERMNQRLGERDSDRSELQGFNRAR